MICTLLGSGTSTGVPLPGCDCAVCTSSDPRDRRLRTGLWVTSPHPTSLLFDTSADLRQQVLRAGIRHLDAAFITHGHADHIMGLDDLRPFTARKNITLPVYSDQETLDRLSRIFDYIPSAPIPGRHLPLLSFREIVEPIVCGDITVEALPVHHGSPGKSLAYLLTDSQSKMAYIPDCNGIPPHSAARLHGLDVLIIDGLRDKPHPTHFTIQEACDCIEKLAPQRAWLTHLSHDILHHTLEERLPTHIRVAYDGLIINTEDKTTRA